MAWLQGGLAGGGWPEGLAEGTLAGGRQGWLIVRGFGVLAFAAGRLAGVGGRGFGLAGGCFSPQTRPRKHNYGFKQVFTLPQKPYRLARHPFTKKRERKLLGARGHVLPIYIGA